MPKPKRSIRPIEKSISLPEDLVAQVELRLFSDLEGRVPHGAWSKYVAGLIRDDFERLYRADLTRKKENSSGHDLY